MSIQILPIQLANQIAAGEVVERPASVVKELVENSLDSGASQIEIEIEKGGHKRICIRDNGHGIAKQELGLALSRHATSKICQLDDLESIVSLGFRGEALASISSVSRLTLTSKPAEQDAAWQACAQGRDMDVDLQPAAHPNGTSVEVVDLFFNTPARRKFLRAEKTEFMHIDEVVRRIALSRNQVGFVLKHNGKVVRKYPALKEGADPLKRIAAICSAQFAETSIFVQSEYQDLRLYGYMAPPSQARSQNDLQYFYVNGRMMRDKLINHAIRQAYEGLLGPDLVPAYVLYLEIDPHQVDVNVHPAKHEVRFHQSRLVHDFIFRALNDGLSQSLSELSEADAGYVRSDEQVHQEVVNHDYIRPLMPSTAPSSSYMPINENVAQQHTAPISQAYDNSERVGMQSSHQASTASSQPGHFASAGRARYSGAGSAPRAAEHYQALMSSSGEPTDELLHVFPVDSQWLLVGHQQQTYKVAMADILQCQLAATYTPGQIVSQPLLMPVSVSVDKASVSLIGQYQQQIESWGLKLGQAQKRILVRQVPAGMRQLNWSFILDQLLKLFVTSSTQEHNSEELWQAFLAILADAQCTQSGQKPEFVMSQINWLRHQQQDITSILDDIGQIIHLSKWLQQDD